jgi:hypothetical protein
MADVTITLNVNTSQINVHNIDSESNFGQVSGITNENYTTNANAGDTITWQGLSSVSASDIVNITAINYEGGQNVFNQNNLAGNGLNPEKVIGVVQNGTAGKTEIYTLFFTVYNNGTRRGGTFRIDPKLAINP